MRPRFKVKVWRDKLYRYPAKWGWEVTEFGGKVLGCGTTSSKSASQEIADRLVAERLEAERMRADVQKQMMREREWAIRHLQMGRVGRVDSPF